MERGVQLSVQLEVDDNGYLDRQCPSTECQTCFKVKFDDWRDIVREEVVYCPLCRHASKASEWDTPEQAEYIERAAVAHVERTLGRALKNDARRFNAKQSCNSFVSISMSYKPQRVSIPIPATATEIMTQEYLCTECKCRYSSIGVAFFCPSCGHNSVFDTFANSIETVKETIVAIPTIRAALTASTNKNTAEDSIRHICENGLVKVVSSFQRYAEACFHKHPKTSHFKIRKNLFQNLDESDKMWRDATRTGYTDILTNHEYQALSTYFQQRHLLAHQDGIVDQQYIDRAKDNRFDINQRLVITDSNVTELITVIEKLTSGIIALIQPKNCLSKKHS